MLFPTCLSFNVADSSLRTAVSGANGVHFDGEAALHSTVASGAGRTLPPLIVTVEGPLTTASRDRIVAGTADLSPSQHQHHATNMPQGRLNHAGTALRSESLPNACFVVTGFQARANHHNSSQSLRINHVVLSVTCRHERDASRHRRCAERRARRQCLPRFDTATHSKTGAPSSTRAIHTHARMGFDYLRRLQLHHGQWWCRL
jgi:hypothetical protein